MPAWVGLTGPRLAVRLAGVGRSVYLMAISEGGPVVVTYLAKGPSMMQPPPLPEGRKMVPPPAREPLCGT